MCDLRINYDRNKLLGKGGYAAVFEGTYNNIKVAVKRIQLAGINSSPKEEGILKRLKHQNVIKFYYSEDSQDFRCFALELCAATLDKLFLDNSDKNKYRGKVPSDEQVLLQLALGLRYIHGENLVHRDIKPENVLLSATEPVVMKWSDFGLSKPVNERGTFTMSDIRGTWCWLPPEIMKLVDKKTSEDKRRGTTKSDVFSTGCLFVYFFLKGIHPFGSNDEEIINNIIAMKLVNNLPDDHFARAVTSQMMTESTQTRWTINQVVDFLSGSPTS